MSARAIGAILLVEPGVAVWSTKREREIPGGTKPLGGVVIHIEDRPGEEPGEIDRRFVCIDHEDTRPAIRWFTISQDEVDRDTAVALEPRQLVNLWRRLAEGITFSGPGRRRRSHATKDEALLADAIDTLVGLVVGPAGPLYGLLQPPRPQPPAPERPSAPVNVSAFVD